MFWLALIICWYLCPPIAAVVTGLLLLLFVIAFPFYVVERIQEWRRVRRI